MISTCCAQEEEKGEWENPWSREGLLVTSEAGMCQKKVTCSAIVPDPGRECVTAIWKKVAGERLPGEESIKVRFDQSSLPSFQDCSSAMTAVTIHCRRQHQRSARCSCSELAQC